jgi:hypothetical protein
MRNFKLLAATGSTPGPQGSIQLFNEIAEIRGNQQEILDIPFPPEQRVDFISILHAEHKAEWAVNEVEAYASGFVEGAFYVSEIIEFESNMAWGECSAHWREGLALRSAAVGCGWHRVGRVSSTSL